MSKKYNAETINPVNVAFLTLTPVLAILFTSIWLSFEHFDIRQVYVSIIFFILSGLSITAGYHRLYSHRSYDAHPVIKILFLCFGAGAFQNSILKWGSDHRLHHYKVDTTEDPYNINESFFYAHMGWILLKENRHIKDQYAKDLYSDKWVMFQHKYYLSLATFFGFILPSVVGYFLFDSWLGAIAVNLCKIVILHHATFFINSLCHYIGSTPYTDSNTAKDSWLMAFFTFGEGYHNFHHYFQNDYRNGILWFQFDPTKWLIKCLEIIGLAFKLKVTPKTKILNTRMQMKMQELKKRRINPEEISELENLKNKIILAMGKWQEFKHQIKKEHKEMSSIKLIDIEMKMKKAQKDLQEAFTLWTSQLQKLQLEYN